MVGTKIGNWTIIEDLGNEKVISINGKIGYRHNYIVRCKCGETRKKPIAKLKGTICNKCAGREYVGDISGAFFCKLKHNARLRNLEFNISKEYLWDLFQRQDGKCALTGRKIALPRDRYEFSHAVGTASVDRICSQKGYVEGNLQFVHKDVNFMKSDWNMDYFIKTCREISNYTKNYQINEKE